MNENHKNNGFTLRRYIPSDIGGILNVFGRSVSGLCAQDYSPCQISAWLACADAQKWNSAFSNRHTTVAESDGKIIGFCDIENNGHIDRLYVAPEYARNGIGKALLKDAENAVNTDNIFVEASITAKPFFEKLGYVAIKKQTVERHGEKLVNYKMMKNR